MKLYQVFAENQYENLQKMSQTTLNNFQFAPLRSLDDFVYESARFQLPNFGDFEKWGNRVVNNLLYYQTNYFVLVAIELIIMGLFQPTKVVLGIFAVASIAYGIYTIFGPNRNPAFDQLRSMNKYAVYALLFGVAFIILYLFDAVLFVTFSILFPISSK